MSKGVPFDSRTFAVGDAYDAYAEQRAAPMQRTFSWSRALKNREHHAMAGLMLGLLALSLKTWR